MKEQEQNSPDLTPLFTEFLTSDTIEEHRYWIGRFKEMGLSQDEISARSVSILKVWGENEREKNRW